MTSLQPPDSFLNASKDPNTNANPIQISSLRSNPLVLPKQKIPNRPIYRPMRIYEKDRARKIQVKLWKTLNCKILQLDPHSRDNPGELILEKSKRNPSSLVCSSTFKKCLKHVKNLTISNSEMSKRFFAQKLRPEKLTLSRLRLQNPILLMLKRFAHPTSLKDLILGSEQDGRIFHSPKYHSKFHSFFPKLKSLYYYVCDYQNFPAFPKKKIRIPIVKSLTMREISFYLGTLNTEHSFKHLEKLELFFGDRIPQKFLSPLQVNQLVNIKSLRFGISRYGNVHSEFDFAILKDCKKIESLHVTLDGVIEKSLETLFQFPNLKDLAIIKRKQTSQASISPDQFTLYPILNLKSLTLRFEPGASQVPIYSHLLNRITVSDSLNLHGSISDFVNLIKGNFHLPLKALRLQIHNSASFELPVHDLEAFTDFIRQQFSVKSFSIDFCEYCFYRIINSLLQSAEGLSQLENFELRIGKVGGLESGDFINLQTLLMKLKALKTCRIEIPNWSINFQELMGIINGIKELQSLEGLYLDLDIPSVGEVAFKMFVELLYSVKHVGNLNIKVKSYPEQEMKIREIFGYNISLYEFPFHCFEPTDDDSDDDSDDDNSI